MKELALTMMLCLSAGLLQAKSFGIYGAVFPIAEESFLHLIESRLKKLVATGEWDSFNQQWRAEVSRQVLKPTPLNLPRAQKTRIHHWRPALRLTQPIRDLSGRLIYPAGTTVNALKELPAYQPCWLFFNNEDVVQRRWALKVMPTCTNPKLILTGGAIDEAESIFKTAIYFDQAGRITTKLSIQSVPAKVTRDGNDLLIEEFAIQGGL
ncbi:Type-F conjugative transfer system protein [Legionella donaldsonii]|uniref:Type-F conjugative transfer system protein n=1 Tax=Legionella donaldsonii TaxID=45060 RepID=A0A378J045_9GAMM|nr:type-F conjugative transfer system protein TraW [Legionella donaldsonii]STX41114.1 Type-F conjugative transfer system protein [Legionella donaldsonii]